MSDLATDDQRWYISELFGHFGITDPRQIRADAARILKLDDGLTDLRNLTRTDADELISELLRAVAAERVSDE
jgi:FMN-dependent NADH-azoreductase